jgi:hypothetical protein
MELDAAQVAQLKVYFPKLSSFEEGEGDAKKIYVLIEALELPEGCQPRQVEGLLCPSARDGYTSRLFLSQKVKHKGRGINWNADGVQIGNRPWWAVSWKTGTENLTLLGMVMAHLEAFK